MIVLTPPPENWRQTLRRGDRGEDCASWQRVLEHSALSLAPYGADGAFGRLTEKRTIVWQARRGLVADGIVGPATRAAIGAPSLQPTPPTETHADPIWPLVHAAGWRWANRERIRLIVIHTMETPERHDTAEGVAAWFAGLRGEPPKASAHVCVDDDSLVRCVPPQHIAWAAPGANRDGYHVELAGRARQSAAEWSDEYSTAMLGIAARHCAVIARRYKVPLRRLSVEQVNGGKASGFCGHHDVSKAFGKSTHWDPGPHFPWDGFLERVRAAS